MQKTLQDYITESEAWVNSPAVGDDFAINIREECLVESHIVDVTEDGVVLAADDKMIQILESYGLLETADPYRREVSPPSAEEFEESALGEQRVDSPVASAIARRILNQRHDLLQYGPEAVMAAIDQVAEWVGDVEEIGSSDISAWVKQVERMLRTQDGQGVAEGSEWETRHDEFVTVGDRATPEQINKIVSALDVAAKQVIGKRGFLNQIFGKQSNADLARMAHGAETLAKHIQRNRNAKPGTDERKELGQHLVYAVSLLKRISGEQGVAEGFGDARYKIKVIGKDKNGDYYVSPNTGKKVYKKANRGDHESPSGILMAKIKEQDMAEAFMGYEIRRVPNLKISYEDSQELKRLISVITQRLARMPHSDPKDENNWRELVTAKNSILSILQKNGLQESDIRQPIDNMSQGVAEGSQELRRIQELAGMTPSAPVVDEAHGSNWVDDLYYEFNERYDLPRDIDDDAYLDIVTKFLNSQGIDPNKIEDIGELFIDMRYREEQEEPNQWGEPDAGLFGDDEQYDDEDTMEAKYQGREVPLGKPMQGDVKKFKVYVKDPKTGNIKKVNFGDKTMRIKKSNPARRKSFRARHNCANPGPRTKARYWSCRKW